MADETNPGKTDSTAPNGNKPLVIRVSRKYVIAISLLLLLAMVLVMGYLWQKEVKNVKEKNNQISALEKSDNEKAVKISELETELESRKETTGEENINKDQYQSIFLKEGQVYFGKITKITETQITLEEIFYLSLESGGDTPGLVKLGDELHGPEDVMYIERKEVQFWENLKNDGQVAKAIADYVKSRQ